MKRCTDPELGALLHAYELGALSEDDIERFELHTMKCEFCYNEIAMLEKYTDTMRHSAAAQSLVAESVAQKPGWESGRLWRHLWPKGPLLLRPALLLLVVLAMLYPAYRGFVPVSDNAEKARAVQLIRFSPTRATQSTTFNSGSGRQGVISYTFAGAVAGREYEIAVVAEDSTVLVRYRELCTSDYTGGGNVLLPLYRMKTGIYHLIISDPNDLTAPDQEYYFRVED